MFYDVLEKDEIKRVIAMNLKNLRRQRGLTQEDLINDIGDDLISLRSYKSYESDSSTLIPTIEKLAILANYYGCSIDYLIYDRSSIYDDSFSKKDSLMRLCGLIYSLSLRPVKATDPNDPYYGSYYFLSFDPEINLLMDKIEAKSREKNIKYYKNNESLTDLLDTYYSLVDEIDDLDDDWSPSFERFNQLLERSGINQDDYILKHLMKCEKEKAYYKKRKKGSN